MFHFQSRFRLAALLLAAPLIFSACKKDKDDPQPDEDNEQITTVTYVLTPTTGGAPVTATWRDLDGTGGAAPTFTPLRLQANTTYTGTISLSDETKTPVVNTSAEILNEKDDHLFFYESTPAGLLNVTLTDRDTKNLPMGLTTSLVTTAASTGSLKITLRHQPGVKNGSFAPGDTDAEVNFPVTVQ